MILAFDFDGVICDSAGETAISGWEAAVSIWPEMKNKKLNAEIIDAFRRCRPVLETGYQSILINRLLFNNISPDAIIDQSSDLFEKLIIDEKLDKNELIGLFGNTRDAWIEEDFDSWLNVHAFYPGVLEKINALCRLYPVFIITTKEKRFAEALADHAGLFIQDDAIFGLESGRKSGVLDQMAKRYPDHLIHFFEDRLKTILPMQKPGLKCYLAKWGYNLEQDRQRAESCAHITTLSLLEFINLSL